MKQSGRTPLHQALAESQKPGVHPDADQLNAFTEGLLLSREREEMLAHLSVCVHCREIAGLAAAAAPVEAAATAQVTRAAAASTKRVPARWLLGLALAASLTAVFAIVGLQSRHGMGTPDTRIVASAPPPEQIPAPPGQPEVEANQQAPKETRAPAHHAPKASPLAPPIAAAQSSGDVAARAQSGTVAASVTAQPPLASESVEVTAEAIPEPVPTEQVAAPRAKSRGPGSAIGGAATLSPLHGMYRASNARSARVRWRINEQGKLERAVDDGAWQPFPLEDSTTLRVVSVMGKEIWAGGEGLRLYHSSDNGDTWQTMTLPPRGDSRTITHIEFETPLNGTVHSESDATWTTVDGGRTWD